MGLVDNMFKVIESDMCVRFLAGTGLDALLAQVRTEWQRTQRAWGDVTVDASRTWWDIGTARAAGRLEARRARGWTPRPCAHCGAREPEPHVFKVCSRCRDPAYCCREHQVAHWKAGHKAACRTPDADADDAEE